MIRDPNHFQYDPKRFGSNYQFFSVELESNFEAGVPTTDNVMTDDSDDDNIADQRSFLRITDHFCGS